MLVLYIYLLFEFGYYLYCHIFIYRALNNRCYTKNRCILSKEVSKDICAQFKEYIRNEDDLIKYLLDSFPNKDLITIENIKKVLLYHIYNIDPCSNICDDGIIRDNSINEIVDIIKSRAGSLIQPYTCTSKTSEIISNHFMTNRLNILYKPCIFYVLIYLDRRVFNFYMYTLGFTNIIDPSTQL